LYYQIWYFLQAMKKQYGKKPVPNKPTAKQKVPAKALYWLGLAVIAIVYIKCYTDVFDYKLDMGGDNIYYYSLGKAIADGRGFSNVIGFEETPHGHYPPGYPVIISLAIRMGCGVTGLKILNGLLLFLACVMICHLSYRITKKRFLALAVTLMMATNYHLLRSATIMMSEIPFLFFTSLALLLFSFLMDRNRFDTSYYLLLFGVASATVAAWFVRAQGIALWLALACVLLTISASAVLKNRKVFTWRQHWHTNRLALVALLGIVAFFLVSKAPWDLRNKQHGFSSSYMAQLTAQLGGTHITDLQGWVDRIEKNTVRYITKEIPNGLFMKTVNYEQPATGKDWTKGIAILGVIIFGLFQLKKKDVLLFYYVGGTAGILLFWPDIWFSPRFMSPVIPLLLLLFAIGLVKIVTLAGRRVRLKQTGFLYPVVLLVALFCMYPNSSKAIRDAKMAAVFRDYTPANTSPQFAEYLDAIRWVRDNLPDTVRVATRKPEIFYAYSGGRKSISFPYYGTPEEIIDFLTNKNIRYVIIDRWFRHANITVIPAVQKYQDKFRIVHQITGTDKDAAPTYVLEFNSRLGYTGETKDGQPHGQGTLALQDGRTYTGAFVNGVCEGYGVMTDAYGNILAKGIWRNNVLIRPEFSY
jgi:4-amino-4-deoxy-L-arabinose transferase-like glycosyltransferase